MSWYQLLSIYTEAAAYVEEERITPPTACPWDGEPLRQGPDQELFCPLGDYSYPRMRRYI